MTDPALKLCVEMLGQLRDHATADAEKAAKKRELGQYIALARAQAFDTAINMVCKATDTPYPEPQRRSGVLDSLHEYIRRWKP